MKFFNLSSKVLATLLASVALVSASGPTDGEAIAPADSAVVKLTAEKFETFLAENPLVLAEFFAPWCGYCKILGPEFAQAADSLSESHPEIKLAQIDCIKEADLCQSHDIKAYPTLKVFRGANADDYNGPREAAGIADYMVQLSLPAVQTVQDFELFLQAAEKQSRPFVVQILPPASHKSSAAQNETFADLANQERSRLLFFSIEDDAVIAQLDKQVNADLSGKKPKYLVIHPGEFDDVREFSGALKREAFVEWAVNSMVPDFGDINRDTYLLYMNSNLPLGYYFYNNAEERAAMEAFFKEQGKKYRGKLSFVGLDASQFGRHAEVLNMDPEIVPLFAIQETAGGKKYGVNQTEHPDGPSEKVIAEFVDLFLAGKAEHIVKSEPLPTQEEIDAQPVTKLVTHNYDQYVGDYSKDVFVKYYANWCSHCKKLAPIWEELAEVFDPKQVVIAKIEHTLNDVDTPLTIEGYPTLVFYPANGEVNPETGFRKHITYQGPRELENFVNFIKESAGTEAKEMTAPKIKKPVVDEEAIDNEEVEAPVEEEVDHDEL
ncbi:protein disulfide isomerase [Metschnikowia bicuspidata]|uniref:protein disulfide-isomerase n=1 Tax=Metschnikowia bicuspidata TaxID=27322 RepID=A0A4V1J392_9ASCO|nr:protein disulfide isomerase [Metschnikowia bicuspidata]